MSLLFVVSKKRNNTLGKVTFEQYYEQRTPRSAWKLSFPIGQNISHHIEIQRFEKQNNKIEKKTDTKEKVINKIEHSKDRVFNFTYNPHPFHVSSKSVLDYQMFYNLIVGGIEHAIFKKGSNTIGSFTMSKERILDSWCVDLVKPLAYLGLEERATHVLFPTIFIANQGSNKNTTDDNFAHFGYIKRIDVFGNYVKIIFELHSKFRLGILYENSLELGIERFELNNTHWAVKQVNLKEELNKFF